MNLTNTILSSNKRILITGGCGFIGSGLIRYLLVNSNWKIFNLFNLLFKIHYEYRDAGDLAFECGKKLVSSGFNQADLMIKLASLMMYDGQFTEASNLLKGAEEHPSVTKKMAAIEARIKELDDSLKIVPNFSPSPIFSLISKYPNGVLLLSISLPVPYLEVEIIYSLCSTFLSKTRNR